MRSVAPGIKKMCRVEKKKTGNIRNRNKSVQKSSDH